MPTTWYQAQVTQIINVSSKIKRFILSIDDNEVFLFEAGQFITFDLPISEKRLNRWRSYSIASRPDGTNKIELCIVHLEGGGGSAYFFTEVKIGTLLKFKGPDGSFTLKQPIDYDLVMLCTGTGIAPFKSMLDHIFFHNITHKNIHLIFGTRKETDIIYRQELQTLASEQESLTYDVVLSQEPLWHGKKGHIHQVYLEQYGDTRPDVKFMICGWSKMVDEAVANLLVKCNYDRTQIHFELYG